MDFTAYLGCLARTMAFLHTAPIVSEEAMPERARLALAALLALVLVPAGGLPAQGFAERMILEGLTGLVLGLALAWPWATVQGLLPMLGGAAGLDSEDEEDESIITRLATAVALTAFLGLSGERFLITVLAAPCQIPSGVTSIAEFSVRAGSACYAIAADGLVPLLAVLAAARIAGALVMRGSAMDLSGVHIPVMAVAGVVLLTAFVQSAPILYEDALHEGARLGSPRKGGR